MDFLDPVNPSAVADALSQRTKQCNISEQVQQQKGSKQKESDGDSPKHPKGPGRGGDKKGNSDEGNGTSEGDTIEKKSDSGNYIIQATTRLLIAENSKQCIESILNIATGLCLTAEQEQLDGFRFLFKVVTPIAVQFHYLKIMEHIMRLAANDDDIFLQQWCLCADGHMHEPIMQKTSTCKLQHADSHWHWLVLSGMH